MPDPSVQRPHTIAQQRRWNFQAAYAAIFNKATALNRFQLSERPRKKRLGGAVIMARRFRALVAKNSKPGSSTDVRVHRWKRKHLKRLLRGRSVEAEYENATAQELVGQTIHYGVFDPAVMFMPSDDAIINACKDNSREALVNKGLQVPKNVQRREAKLRAADGVDDPSDTARNALQPTGNDQDADSNTAEDASDIESIDTDDVVISDVSRNRRKQKAKRSGIRRTMSSLDNEDGEPDDILDNTGDVNQLESPCNPPRRHVNTVTVTKSQHKGRIFPNLSSEKRTQKDAKSRKSQQTIRKSPDIWSIATSNREGWLRNSPLLSTLQHPMIKDNLGHGARRQDQS